MGRDLDAGDNVEKGGFASTIRSDERNDLSEPHLETDIDDSRQPTEMLGNVRHLKAYLLAFACMLHSV